MIPSWFFGESGLVFPGRLPRVATSRRETCGPRRALLGLGHEPRSRRERGGDTEVVRTSCPCTQEFHGARCPRFPT